MPRAKAMLIAALSALFVASAMLLGCGGPPAAGLRLPNGDQLTDLSLQARLLGLYVCMIHHRHKVTETGVYTGGIPDTVFVGPDGHPQRLTREQCQQENQRSLQAEEEAYQRTISENQRAAEHAQQKRAVALALIVRGEEARGYKHVTFKDLLLDARDYAARGTKVAISGFYKRHGRHDERLYASSQDLMMHTYQPIEASYIALIADEGSRSLREYLMRCSAGIGCDVTILGHVSPCVETNAFGTRTGDVCVVAEDMRPPETP